MANSRIAMQYDLRQNNTKNNSSFGRWYPWAVRSSTLNTRGLADHIVSHGSVYTRDVVEGMVIKFRECIVELLMRGVGVKLEGLGTFYPTLEASGAASPEGYDVREHLKGIHIRFMPDKCRDDDLTSHVLAGMVALEKRLVIDRHGVPVMETAQEHAIEAETSV